MKREFGYDAQLIIGEPGEFTIWLDGRQVSGKKDGAFPADADIVKAVKAAVKT